MNESTQSAAEFVTMHLQSIPGAITVGSQTAGADGDIVKVMMPGDLSFYFSSIKVLYPDGTDTQRVGVRIDYEVKPTIEGVKNGRDEVLEYALSLVD
ncbi:S41 family peptidase [uncultured Alistipes sp.]|uniref:S41 family peptidase n=1 Tax=uncultured Alistipes sp. TaxID=538949 RepID=UPI0026103990|nr:S41 family peptidase [uncultured Alistipes sp.]